MMRFFQAVDFFLFSTKTCRDFKASLQNINGQIKIQSSRKLSRQPELSLIKVPSYACVGNVSSPRPRTTLAFHEHEFSLKDLWNSLDTKVNVPLVKFQAPASPEKLSGSLPNFSELITVNWTHCVIVVGHCAVKCWVNWEESKAAAESEVRNVGKSEFYEFKKTQIYEIRARVLIFLTPSARHTTTLRAEKKK